MFDLASIKDLSTKGVLPITNDTIKYLNSIENLNFRLHQGCDDYNNGHCEKKETCNMFRDCYTLSERMAGDNEGLSMVLNDPILKQSLALLFPKLMEPLQYKIACFGHLKTKTNQELEFISKMNIEPDVKNAGLFFDRKGAANYLLGNYEEAISCFDEAIDYISNNPNIYYRRGESKYRLELHEEADQDFGKAMDLNEQVDKEMKLAGVDIGTVHLRMGRFEEAEKDFLKVIELEPDHPDANCRLGEIYANCQNNLEALETSIQFFKTAIRKNNDHLEARYKLSVAFYHAGLFIGGDTSLLYYESDRKHLHNKISCNLASHKTVIAYCKKGMVHVDWLIKKTEESTYISPKRRSIRLGRFKMHKGKLLKLMGDNAQQVSMREKSDKLREKAIMSLETLENVPILKHNIESILDILINFHIFSKNEQRQKTAQLMGKFEVIVRKRFHLSREDRHTICTASAYYFASIGSFKIAEQYIKKLESLEQKGACRGSEGSCQLLRTQFDDLKYEKYKQQINLQKVLYYSEAVKNLETAVTSNPKNDYFEHCIVVCLSIGTFLPKLARTFVEKASVIVAQGLDRQPNNEILSNLSKTIRNLKSQLSPSAT
ncbi:MAG: tetratricopeptide repeat protein [Deltaproteobacteria bacterium]|nr:tetratricopeptide repeat protein [Deltaproteobacteria bacterium]